MSTKQRSLHWFILLFFVIVILEILNQPIGNSIQYEAQITVIRNSNETTHPLENTEELEFYDISYSSYVGGSGNDISQSIVIDSEGSIYIGGSTDSSDFLNLGDELNEMQGKIDCFVLKFDSSGTELVYATMIGGIYNDELTSIYVDSTGCVYGTGRTNSPDFPTVNAFNDTNSGAGDCFVFKLNPSGNELVYSTFVGGSDNEFANDITVDSEGCAYVTGSTFSRNGRDFDFPLVNPFDDTWNGENEDTFVFKLSAEGDSLVYSTIIGGFAGDWLDSIVVDSQGNAVVTGNAESEDWPMVNAFDPTWSSSLPNLPDIVLFKLNASGNGLVWSTYIGGNGSDYARAVALDTSDNVYVVGGTSSHDFPLVNPIQSSFSGGWSDIFILKMSSDGQSLLYSTYMGGNELDEARDILIDNLGYAYIAGYSNSLNFPITNATGSENKGDYDSLVVKLNPEGNSSVFSSYYGGSNDDRAYGIAIRDQSTIYITGRTSSLDFPKHNEDVSSYYGGEDDGFILMLELEIYDKTETFVFIFVIISIIGIGLFIGVIIHSKKIH